MDWTGSPVQSSPGLKTSPLDWTSKHYSVLLDLLPRPSPSHSHPILSFSPLQRHPCLVIPPCAIAKGFSLGDSSLLPPRHAKKTKEACSRLSPTTLWVGTPSGPTPCICTSHASARNHEIPIHWIHEGVQRNTKAPLSAPPPPSPRLADDPTYKGS